jgi:hypothetical protein
MGTQSVYANSDRDQTGTSLKLLSNGFEYNGLSGESYVYIAIAKGGTTRFFDTEAFEAITDNDVIARYGVDPYTTNLESLGIKELTHEPVGITAAFIEDGDKMKPLRDQCNEVSSLESKLTTAQAKVTDLETRVLARIRNIEIATGSLNAEVAYAVNGYYPLYSTEAVANAAGNGSSHSHTFDGVTYYMPEGVTYYHGDYS